MYTIKLCIVIAALSFFECHANKQMGENSDYTIQKKIELEDQLRLIKNHKINRIVVSYTVLEPDDFEIKEIELSPLDVESILKSLRNHLYIPTKIISPPKVAISPKVTTIIIGFNFFVNEEQITTYALYPQTKNWTLELPMSEHKKLLDRIITILNENNIRIPVGI